MRSKNARLGIETTIRSDLIARSATNLQSSQSIGQGHTARPDRNVLEKASDVAQAVQVRVQFTLDQFKEHVTHLPLRLPLQRGKNPGWFCSLHS
jgi:hypothetical protein